MSTAPACPLNRELCEAVAAAEPRVVRIVADLLRVLIDERSIQFAENLCSHLETLRSVPVGIFELRFDQHRVRGGHVAMSFPACRPKEMP